MHLELRRDPLRRFHDNRIRRDDSGDARDFQLPQVLFQPRDIFVMRVDIRRDEYFRSVLFGELHAFLHFFEAEIIRIGTKAVFLAPDIYGIRAVVNGEFQFLQIAGRSQQFRFVQPVSFPLQTRGCLRCHHPHLQELTRVTLIHLFFIEKSIRQLSRRILQRNDGIEPFVMERIALRVRE